jgi:hypothetical protein
MLHIGWTGLVLSVWLHHRSSKLATGKEGELKSKKWFLLKKNLLAYGLKQNPDRAAFSFPDFMFQSATVR